MYRNYFIILLSFFTITHLFSQVGIGTTNPMQDLHIAGNNSTIRIEGLNATNNTLNNGSGNIPVSVNTNGDLVLGQAVNAIIDIHGTSSFPTTTVSSGSGYDEETLNSGTFTLGQERWVSGTFEVAVQDVKQAGGTNITDGAPRIVTSIIYIDGIQISRDSQLYNNSRSGGTIASGYLVLDGSFFLKIPAGNHTYSIVVSIYGGSYSSRALFGGVAAIDRFQLIGL
mgnify:CR=1 FL=1